MTSAVGFTGTSVSALYQILAEKDQPDGYVGLDANGKISVQYLPDEIPKDFTDVEIKTNKNQPNGYPGLDAGGQLAASVIPPGAYILSSDKGAVNGVAPLDATGTILYSDLPTGATSTTVAIGNHSHSGEFVLNSQVNQANGVAGLNGLSQLAIAQIPTGTAANNVALGNHGHAGQFEPVINPKRTAFNKDFGGSAGQVAEGNHVHDAGDLTTGRIAYSLLPTGTVVNTVAEGNHTHSDYWSSTNTPKDFNSWIPDIDFSGSGDFTKSISGSNSNYYRFDQLIKIILSITFTVTAGTGGTVLFLTGLPFLSVDGVSFQSFPLYITGVTTPSDTSWVLVLAPDKNVASIMFHNLITGVRTHINDLSAWIGNSVTISASFTYIKK